MLQIEYLKYPGADASYKVYINYPEADTCYNELILLSTTLKLTLVTIYILMLVLMYIFLYELP